MQLFSYNNICMIIAKVVEGCHLRRRTEQPIYWIILWILKSSIILIVKIQGPNFKAWDVFQENWKQPEVIKMKSEETYHTSRSKDVGRAMGVSEPVLRRKWAALSGKIWVMKEVCWERAWVSALVRGKKWDLVGGYKELQSDQWDLRVLSLLCWLDTMG